MTDEGSKEGSIVLIVEKAKRLEFNKPCSSQSVMVSGLSWSFTAKRFGDDYFYMHATCDTNLLSVGDASWSYSANIEYIVEKWHDVMTDGTKYSYKSKASVEHCKKPSHTSTSRFFLWSYLIDPDNRFIFPDGSLMIRMNVSVTNVQGIDLIKAAPVNGKNLKRAHSEFIIQSTRPQGTKTARRPTRSQVPLAEPTRNSARISEKRNSTLTKNAPAESTPKSIVKSQSRSKTAKKAPSAPLDVPQIKDLKAARDTEEWKRRFEEKQAELEATKAKHWRVLEDKDRKIFQLSRKLEEKSARIDDNRKRRSL